jgi:hypothetical protein
MPASSGVVRRPRSVRLANGANRTRERLFQLGVYPSKIPGLDRIQSGAPMRVERVRNPQKRRIHVVRAAHDFSPVIEEF